MSDQDLTNRLNALEDKISRLCDRVERLEDQVDLLNDPDSDVYVELALDKIREDLDVLAMAMGVRLKHGNK